MALKSIIDIDVNDKNFAAFSKQYDAWQKSLARLPAAWRAVNQQVAGGKSLMDTMVERQTRLNREAATQAKIQEEIDRRSRSIAERWRDSARSAGTFASNIKDAMLSLLRVGAISGAISGLLGAGGLFGLDRLAIATAGGRRNALGLGTDIGGARAFGANFSRLVDPEAFLSGVAGAKLDVTRRVGLLGAGLSEKEISGDTSNTAVALIKRLKVIADQTNPALYGQVIQARQLNSAVPIGPEDLLRLRNTSQGELNDIYARFGAAKGASNVPDDVAKQYQNLVTQLTNSGNAIEATLVRGLVKLAPQIEKLSDSVAKTIDTFLKSPTLGRWIDDLSKGVKTFAEYIGTKEFQDNVLKFVEGIGAIASAVSSFAPSAKAVANTARGAKTVLYDIPKAALSGNIDLFPETPGRRSRITPTELLGIVRRLEGSGDREVSNKGAVGRYQITPDTARTYGADPSKLTDPVYNEATARKILADLARRYHGNVPEILAAYNAGPGRADRFHRAGDDVSVLPAETRGYLGRARGMTEYAPTVVTIENNTGGNATVSVNGLKN